MRVIFNVLWYLLLTCQPFINSSGWPIVYSCVYLLIDPFLFLLGLISWPGILHVILTRYSARNDVTDWHQPCHVKMTSHLTCKHQRHPTEGFPDVNNILQKKKFLGTRPLNVMSSRSRDAPPLHMYFLCSDVSGMPHTRLPQTQLDARILFLFYCNSLIVAMTTCLCLFMVSRRALPEGLLNSSISC